MIRAFDHVVRANRQNSIQAAVVIGNAMQALSDMELLREESAKDIVRNIHRYPPQILKWVQKTFPAGSQMKPTPDSLPLSRRENDETSSK